LRWASYAAAQRARFPTSPDRDYYPQTKDRIGGNRACVALVCKLHKRSYRILKALTRPSSPSRAEQPARGKLSINRRTGGQFPTPAADPTQGPAYKE
jgi:hypothetical protein